MKTRTTEVLNGETEEPVINDEQVIAEADQKRRAALDRKLNACAKEVQIVLERHGCVLAPMPFLTPDGRLSAEVKIAIRPAN